jgi:polysaccharide biosynthesis transport protein
MRLHFLLLDVSETIRRRRLPLLLPWVSVLLAGILTAYLLPEKYESFSTVIVQREAAPGHPEGNGTTDYLSLFTEIVHSRSTLEAVADSLLEAVPPASRQSLQKEVGVLQGSVTTEQRGPDACRIIVTDDDPEMARRVAALVTAVALQTSGQADRRQLDEAVQFYERKLAEYEHSSAAGGSTGPGVSAGGDIPALRSSLWRTSTELQETESSFGMVERSLAMIRAAIGSLDEPATISRLASIDSRAAGPLAGNIRTLAARYASLLTRYRALHPEVQGVRRQLLGMLDKVSMSLETERSQLQPRIAELQRKQRQLRERALTAAAQPGVTPAQPPGTEVSRDLLADLRRQLERARVDRDLRVQAGNRFSVLDKPQTPPSPASPDRPFIIGLATLLGFLTGLACVMAAESLDATIRRPGDLEVFRKPVIAILP